MRVDTDTLDPYDDDDADPYGMKRPGKFGLTKHKGYQEPTQVSKRTINKGQFAVGEGNKPYGVPRPNAPYDQDMEPKY